MYKLPDTPDETGFPPVEYATPDGLLAIGGALSTERLLSAYRQGIFPWYSEDQPVLWWSPDPRAVLYPSEVRITRSLQKTLRQVKFSVTFDRCFEQVMRECAAPRRQRPDEGTWITPDMLAAYTRLHELGYAHSVEVWQDRQLVGGLYGVALGRAFFGESMFSRERDASKVALVTLCRQLDVWGFTLIDCQVESEHLASLGAVSIPRARFLEQIRQALAGGEHPGRWDREDDVQHEQDQPST